MADPLHLRIARRIKTLRENRGLTQQQLSDSVGFKDRQTLAAIEAGERAVSAPELARIGELLGVEIEYFTDAFRLVGEGQFSFRAKGVGPDVLDGFEDRARRWVATYRELGEQAGVAPSRLGRKLELSPRSSFEEAHACADEVRQRWRLGDAPAAGLAGAIERELGALVLYVDAPPGVSGAASQLPGLHAILVNRSEPEGRRSYDLGHELFHVLTWDAMPPKRVEPWEVEEKKGNRVEQLAENFAAALLMPEPVVVKRWRARGSAEIHDWLNATATALRVSSIALKWRLHNLGLLSAADTARIDDRRLVNNGRSDDGDPRPPLFSAEFVSRVHGAVESGRLSLRRAAKLLDLDPDTFAELCHSYGLPLSYDA